MSKPVCLKNLVVYFKRLKTIVYVKETLQIKPAIFSYRRVVYITSYVLYRAQVSVIIYILLFLFPFYGFRSNDQRSHAGGGRRRNKFLTCHNTVYHVCFSNSEPWALIVENNVWPALLRIAGLGSTQSSPILEYKAIHSLSEGDNAGSSLGVSPWVCASCCLRASSMVTRFWFKKSEMFH